MQVRFLGFDRLGNSPSTNSELEEENMMCVLDVWGGRDSEEHIARYILTIHDAVLLAELEVQSGFLVNLRAEVAWGGFVNFDKRIPEAVAGSNSTVLKGVKQHERPN